MMLSKFKTLKTVTIERRFAEVTVTTQPRKSLFRKPQPPIETKEVIYKDEGPWRFLSNDSAIPAVLASLIHEVQ